MWLLDNRLAKKIIQNLKNGGKLDIPEGSKHEVQRVVSLADIVVQCLDPMQTRLVRGSIQTMRSDWMVHM